MLQRRVSRGCRSFIYATGVRQRSLISEYLLGNAESETPTYARQDNSDDVCRAGGINAAENEKRRNGFLESNRELLRLNKRMGIVFAPCHGRWPDSLTKCMSSGVIDLLLRNQFKIVPG